ncbi:MAG: superoxide dismutase, Ni [Deltaproteobacteria bacterium]|nr:MAG: superoxide dismutase, Ni [Deltaproteobacteria bacterium]
MLHTLMTKIDKIVAFDQVKAHCDIPCGIYDPITAQVSALTVIRMEDLIAETAAKTDLPLADHARLGRLISEKETHAIKVKEEIRIIWGDYFKGPQLEKFPQTHELVHKIMMQASKAKQHNDRAMCVELLKLVNEFASIFWQTKNVETFTAKCPYPPSEDVVYPKLT